MVKHGKRGEQQRYRCTQCRRTFTESIRSPHYRLRGTNRERMGQAIYDVMIDDQDPRDVASRLGVAASTVYNWIRRVKEDPDYLEAIHREKRNSSLFTAVMTKAVDLQIITQAKAVRLMQRVLDDPDLFTPVLKHHLELILAAEKAIDEADSDLSPAQLDR